MAKQDTDPSETFLSLPKKKSLMKTSTKNWKSNQALPGLASNQETDAINKLYEKFKEISDQKALIQKTINNLDTEYLEEQKKVNGSFDAMILLLEKRKNQLLDDMKSDVVSYKKECNEKYKELSNGYNELKTTKKKVETNINEEDEQSKFDTIDERTVENTKIINDALDQFNKRIKSVKPKHPIFIIKQSAIDDDIMHYGKFILKHEEPDAPQLHILIRTNESVLLEVLFDEKYCNDPVLRYELDIYKGAMDDPLLVKDNEYYTEDILKSNILSDNICFYELKELDDDEEYHFRVRAILFDHNIDSKFSEWTKIKTKNNDYIENFQNESKSNAADFGTYEDKGADLEEVWKKNSTNEFVTNFKEFSDIFKNINLGITKYNQERIFFLIQSLEDNGAGSKIGGGEFANFICNVDTRIEAQDYHNLCSTLKNRIRDQK